MKVLCFPAIPYCFECGLLLSAVRDPITSAKTGFAVYKHVGNHYCENADVVIKLPVTLIDADPIGESDYE